jgi:hypothetical protein
MEINKPSTFKEASVVNKKSIVEIIITFFIVFFVASTCQSIVAMIFGFVRLLVDGNAGEFSEIISDTNKLNNLLYKDNAMMIFTLLSTIACIIVIIIVCTKIEKRPLTSLGLRKKGCIKEYLKGLLVGFIMMSVVVGIEILTGALKITGTGDLSLVAVLLLIGMMIGFFIQSAEEEIMLRGYFLTSLGAHYSGFLAVFISSFAFSLIHLFNDSFSFLSLLNITLIGIFLGLYYIQTDNIWGVAAIHGIWNYSQCNIYGITVSGIFKDNSLLLSEQVKGKELLNGGPFGAEAGIVATIITLVAIFLLLAYMYKKGTIVNKVKKETV